ncbi:MAG TPA: archaetidylserine decarboxylase [Steroidobacteraceae bacterium]|nr:archaetidylserine decarboxylase [Steroidobacteraceae bacterium]
MKKKAFVIIQYLLPKHWLSRLMHAFARTRWRWLKNLTIDVFLRNYQVNMQEAAEPDPHAYESFNAFFTRTLHPSARPIATETGALVSPVDGTISQIGIINDDAIIQAKGHYYSLLALMAGDAALAQRYRGGHFACIYLAPFNYHRIHMPLSGTLSNTIYVPGALFSVNTTTAQSVPNLFARNERVICDFHSTSAAFAMVLVGALFVGSIETVWAGEINPPPRYKQIVEIDKGRGLSLEKGAEAGRFNMGSTVVLLVEPGRMQWNNHLQSGDVVKLGQHLGTLLTA